MQVATSNPLIATKLYTPPSRSRRVTRAHLIERMNAAVRRPLTLICAPAGYGKTTLMSEWVPQNEHCVTWVSLDEGDNDPARFWRYFFAALQTLDARLVTNARLLLESMQTPPIEAVLSQAINELAALDYRFSHVFDDYHLIENPAIDEGLTFLVEHLPPNMNLVIASRRDPALPLARWRARREMAEVRSGDLRFTREEATAFFNQLMKLDLSEEEIAALETRTEGWIAGLQLAALSMQDRSDRSRFIEEFTGSHRFIIDYLAEEVLSRQPEPVREFLLETSILGQLCGPLCDALTGGSDGQAILERLDHANLFVVPLDQERSWYRYHHLFADVLQARLRQERPGAPAELHRRAGAWFTSQGNVEEAVRHALAGDDFEGAAGLIERVAGNVLRRGSSASMIRWLEALPEALILARPRLCLARGWVLFLGPQLSLESADEWAQLALQAATAGGSPDPELTGEVAALQAMLAVTRSEVARSRELSRQALETLPPDSPWRTAVTFSLGTTHLDAGDIAAAERDLAEALRLSQADGTLYVQSAAASFLAEILTRQGRLDRAMELYRQVLSWSERGIVHKGTVMAHGGLANILCERDQPEAALAHLQEGAEQLEGVGGAYAAFVIHSVHARVQRALGNWPGAFEALDRAIRLGQNAQVSMVLTQAAALRARLQLAQGDLEAAMDWAADSGLGPEDEKVGHPGWQEVEYLTLARVLSAQGRHGEALSLLDRLLESAQAEGRDGSAIGILAIQALADQAHGNRALARRRLGRALALAEPEGYVCTFLDEGEPMRALLEDFIRVGITDHAADGVHSLAYANRLLSALATPGPRPPPARVDARPPTSGAPGEPLSERELEILRLIDDGLTNQEIAAQLVIAVSTVKSHINSLYGKLGAHRRTQAITIAKELGLLAD